MEAPHVVVLFLGKEPLSTTGSDLATVRTFGSPLYAEGYQLCHLLYFDMYNVAPGEYRDAFMDQYVCYIYLTLAGCHHLSRPRIQRRCPGILHPPHENPGDLLNRLAHARDPGSDRLPQTRFLRRHAPPL